METKNFFSLPKLRGQILLSYKLLFSSSLIFLLSCQSFPPIESKRSSGVNKDEKKTPGIATANPPSSRETIESPVPTDPGSPLKEQPFSEEEPQPETPVAQSPYPQSPLLPSPKIGLIIGPGFMRSFLAVGILQEFHKARVPIHSLVGFEWGSLPAALYSMNSQANEVEWQMLKLNESAVVKKSLLRKQLESQSMDELWGFLSQAFGRHSFEQARLPFECLTFDYKKRQYFWMRKGELAKALMYCLASPPFSKPYLNNVGAMDLKLAADNLRKKGANYIIFINPLNSNKDYLDENFSTESQLLWALQQYQAAKSNGVVNYVIDTTSAPFSVLDFGSRRDMIRKGQEIGAQAIQQLATKLGI